MMTLMEHLESFHRKERFFLVGNALGNPDFRLSTAFQAKLEAAFGIQPPNHAFVAMDYHLDWLHASLFLALPENDDAGVHLNTETVASGNQEDVDLLIAFEAEDITHLMLVEAKRETGWTNKQTLSTAERLRRIFGKRGVRYPRVQPYFALTSPKPPTKRLKSGLWPDWMTRDSQPIWFELNVPTGRIRVARCDSEGRQTAEGDFFQAVKSGQK